MLTRKTAVLSLVFAVCFAAGAAIACGPVGPCTGPVSCPTSACVDLPGPGAESAYCQGIGLISQCEGVSGGCPGWPNGSNCQDPRCFSDEYCTGIRILPCPVWCVVVDACGLWA